MPGDPRDRNLTPHDRRPRFCTEIRPGRLPGDQQLDPYLYLRLIFPWFRSR
jgi:hypothetical protein